MDYKRELYNYLSKCNGNERSCDLFFELYTLICSFDPPVQHLAVQYMFTTTLLASLEGKGRRFSLPYTESQLEYAMELVENNFYPEFKRKVLNAINQKMEPEKFYHKRGALAMASYYQMEKSSGGHFYIVTGFKYSDTKLFNAEDKYNKKLRKQVFDSITQTSPYAEQLKEYSVDTKRYMPKIRELKKKITTDTDKVMATRKQFHYTKEQKELYKTVGGAADLDGYYTVFGEVIEGLDVLTKIEKRAVDSRLRPIDAVIIKRVREIQY